MRLASREPGRARFHRPINCSRLRIIGSSALAAILLASCTVGPNYVRPPAPAPANYKENSNFALAQPSAAIAKGAWWEIYNDPQLNALEDQVDSSNLTLAAEQERFVQARAAVRITRSGLYPTASGGLSVSRDILSQNRPLASSTSSYNDLSIPVDASYEPDVWGRVRRSVEASRSEAQATSADLASVSLSLHAEVALDYFALRGLDAQKQLLDSTVISYQKALDLTQTRYKGGLASAVDVAQARTQLESTRAQAIDVEVQRAQFEHAVAVLVGKPPAEFNLPPSPLTTPPPNIPVGLPSELLQRRPDIAGAERRVQEANANIGVARAAYFPTFTIGATGGFESTSVGTLLQGPSGFWSLAGQAAELLFDGGSRRGASEQAKSAYNEAVDNYRQAILSAFQDVEDNLAALCVLQEEAQTQHDAVIAAQHSLSLSETRYRGGVTNYLEVTTAQTAALANEVTAVNLLSRRLSASVLLVKAIGGGWNVSKIPSM
ncbi:MAG TPA: efflux transporter outer membrane subunit [Candidatus Acidoferrum sp.]|nr:efflux transporter outer membrane subunit [Candidatus Acidoferrum sp.]